MEFTANQSRNPFGKRTLSPAVCSDHRAPMTVTPVETTASVDDRKLRGCMTSAPRTAPAPTLEQPCVRSVPNESLTACRIPLYFGTSCPSNRFLSRLRYGFCHQGRLECDR